MLKRVNALQTDRFSHRPHEPQDAVSPVSSANFEAALVPLIISRAMTLHAIVADLDRDPSRCRKAASRRIWRAAAQ
jgi:hypothetical protein